MGDVRTKGLNSVLAVIGASNVSFDWGFLFLAIWGGFWLAIFVIDPGKVVETIFEMGRQFRIGPFRYGVWAIAKTKNQFRFISGLICLGLIVFGLLEGIILK